MSAACTASPHRDLAPPPKGSRIRSVLFNYLDRNQTSLLKFQPCTLQKDKCTNSDVTVCYLPKAVRRYYRVFLEQRNSSTTCFQESLTFFKIFRCYLLKHGAKEMDVWQLADEDQWLQERITAQRCHSKLTPSIAALTVILREHKTWLFLTHTSQPHMTTINCKEKSPEFPTLCSDVRFSSNSGAGTYSRSQGTQTRLLQTTTALSYRSKISFLLPWCLWKAIIFRIHIFLQKSKLPSENSLFLMIYLELVWNTHSHSNTLDLSAKEPKEFNVSHWYLLSFQRIL